MSMVDVQYRSDGIVVIAINNPPVNALTTPVFEELRKLALRLTESPL